jgi:excisionase family DNA binding protein
MEQVLTTTQAAERLGISPRRVAALITAGKLPATQFGGSWMIQEEHLALVADRKPGRPKTKVDEAKIVETTRESGPVEAKPAKKRAPKKTRS